MTSRTELMEAALDCYPEGIALLGLEGQVVFWNRAAEAMTGFAGVEVVGRPIPWALEPLLHGDALDEDSGPRAVGRAGGGVLVHAQHKQGHDLPAVMQALVLRDGLGERIGKAVAFHPAQDVNTMTRGKTDGDPCVEEAQSSLEERLQAAFEDFTGGVPLGLLWITVDQAHELRRTHGARACEAMMERVERMLSNGLRPGEEIGRWGDDEFLVISHEHSSAALGTRARMLAGLAKTTDFHWWGDRISLTVSIGAAQAEPADNVVQLLEAAQAAMFASINAGGNCITLAREMQS